MPKVADAAVLAVGSVVDLQDSTDFDTKEKDGVRVLIATGDGFASVKLKLDVAAKIKPVPGRVVAWFLRYGATGGGDRGASSYSTFVREFEPSDLDRLQGLVKQG